MSFHKLAKINWIYWLNWNQPNEFLHTFRAVNVLRSHSGKLRFLPKCSVVIRFLPDNLLETRWWSSSDPRWRREDFVCPMAPNFFHPFGDMTHCSIFWAKNPRGNKNLCKKAGSLKYAKMNAKTDSFGVLQKSWGLENWRQPWSLLDCEKHLWHTPKPDSFTCFRPLEKWVAWKWSRFVNLSPSSLDNLVTFQGRSLEATNGPTGIQSKCRKAIFFGDFNWDIYTRQGGLYIYRDKYIQDIYIYIYKHYHPHFSPREPRRSFSGTRSSEGLGASQEFQGFSTMAWL